MIVLMVVGAMVPGDQQRRTKSLGREYSCRMDDDDRSAYEYPALVGIDTRATTRVQRNNDWQRGDQRGRK